MNIRVDTITNKHKEITLTLFDNGSFTRLTFNTERDQMDIWFPPEAFEPLKAVIKTFGVTYQIFHYSKDSKLETLENWEPPEERG